MSKVEFACCMDGMFHFRGDCCRSRSDCPKCGAIEHYQGIWGGYIEVCESCDVDAFRPAVRDDSVEGGHFLDSPEEWRDAGFEVMAWTPDEDLGKPIVLSAEDFDAFVSDVDEVSDERVAALMRALKEKP